MRNRNIPILLLRLPLSLSLLRLQKLIQRFSQHLLPHIKAINPGILLRVDVSRLNLLRLEIRGQVLRDDRMAAIGYGWQVELDQLFADEWAGGALPGVWRGDLAARGLLLEEF